MALQEKGRDGGALLMELQGREKQSPWGKWSVEMEEGGSSDDSAGEWQGRTVTGGWRCPNRTGGWHGRRSRKEDGGARLVMVYVGGVLASTFAERGEVRWLVAGEKGGKGEV